MNILSRTIQDMVKGEKFAAHNQIFMKISGQEEHGYSAVSLSNGEISNFNYDDTFFIVEFKSVPVFIEIKEVRNESD